MCYKLINRLIVLSQTALIQITIIYFLATFHFALKQSLPEWSIYGNFQMFTFRSLSHVKVRAEIVKMLEYEKQIEPVNLEDLFPSKWESGPRYQRASFLSSPTKMRIFAKSICHRSKVHTGEVRIYRDTWPVTAGVHPNEAKSKITEMIMVFQCQQKIRLPNGREL